MPIIGLAGGIGSGKTAVAEIMAHLGARVLDADQSAHEVLADPGVVAELQAWWGPSVVQDDGRIDRQRVAEIVFEDPGQRERLEGLIHPKIFARWAETLERRQDDPPLARAIVIDAPLLFECRLDTLCDTIVFVEASEEIRAQRVWQARRWSLAELRRREKMQKPLDFKKDRADHIVENNSNESDLRRTVGEIFSAITSSSY